MADTVQGKLGAVVSSDVRLATAALLVASDGEVLGQAAVLSSDLAVTTAEVAQYASAKAAGLGEARNSAFGPLAITFPQFRGAPGVYPLRATIEAIDAERGFASIRFSGILPVPVPTGLLGAGDSPVIGTACDLFYADVSWSAFYQIGAKLETSAGVRLRVILAETLDEPAATALAAAPVFAGYRFIGIVLTASSGIAEVLSVDGMALSRVTPAVRRLLPWIGDESGAKSASTPSQKSGDHEGSSPFANSGKGGASMQRGDSLEEGTGTAANDSSVWERMSAACRFALARADAVRRVIGKRQVHTYHLVTGLIPAWREFFEDAGVSDKVFRDIVREQFGAEIPEDYTIAPLTKLPPRSVNAQHALQTAVDIADRRRSKEIWSSDLLLGVLSLKRSTTLRALHERGIRPDKIRPEDRTERGFTPILLERERDQAPEASPDSSVATVATQNSPVATFSEPSGPLKLADQGSPGYNLKDEPRSAAPTPKVDSDLWCDEDRLGYEAYARTIASLITHEETVAPLTIGIKAPWGAGKTSLMKRVQHLLDGYAELSEEGRTGILQEWQPPQTTLRELLDQLKTSSKPNKLEVKRSKKGEAYGLPPRTTVWFNAWKYQTSEQIWAGMAHCIISQVTARMGVKDREWFWVRLHARRLNVEEIRKKIHGILLRKLIPTALLVVTVCAIAFWIAAALPVVPWWWRGVLRGVPVIWGVYRLNKERTEKLGEKAADTMRELMREPDYEGKMGYLHLVESDMREVLQLATEGSVMKEKPNGDPLVVFVDDLDRCAPNKVAEVVEAINLFLCGDYPNCVFVLGMEPGMVAAALEVANKDVIEKALEMGLMDRTAPVGWRFMEKIVQLPITIPPPTKRGRDLYVESLVGPSKVVSSEPAAPVEPAPPKEEEVREFIQQMQGSSLAEVEEKSLKVVAAASPEKKRAAAEAGKRVYANTFSERDPAIAEFVQEVAELVDGNPRQIKRYVNVFRFYSTLRYGLRADGIVAASDFPTDKVLAKFVALNIQWPHAVDCLRVKRDLGVKGETISRLQYLEEESARITGEACDEDWKKAVDKSGAGSFAAASAFREFLKKGESLGKSLGQGLW